MSKQQEYPLKFVLVNTGAFGTTMKTVAVRETAKFYIADLGHYQSKFKKLDQPINNGRVSESTWGNQSSLSRSSTHLYQLDSEFVQTVKEKYGRKNLVKEVSIAVEGLLKNINDPRIDEIAKILGIDEG